MTSTNKAPHINWIISKEYQSFSIFDKINSLDDAFSISRELKLISRSPYNKLYKIQINNDSYYIKLYIKGGKHFRRFLGRSRLQGEIENLLFFKDIGIPTAELLAYGLEKKVGIFIKGALIIKEIKNAVDISTLAEQKPEIMADRQFIRKISEKIAKYTRIMHDTGFVHNDLKWRNILVTQTANPEVFFIDCPLGRKKTWPLLRHGIIKDLACLDKVARIKISRTARLRFYKKYINYNRITQKDKFIIKRISHFFDGRE